MRLALGELAALLVAMARGLSPEERMAESPLALDLEAKQIISVRVTD
jgi:hypothetical protein